jgi:thiosulfate dehydrogenase
MTHRRRYRALVICTALILPIALPHAAENLKAPPADPAWDIPDIETLPDDDHGRLVRQGNELIAKTYSHIGPGVADPAKRYAGNTLSCRNCHLEDGVKKFGLPLWGLKDLFPQPDAVSGTTMTLQHRVNDCVVRSLNGSAVPMDGPEMRAVVAYLDFLSTGLKPGERLTGYGSGEMPELDRPADPQRGSVVYREACARCHGADGEGIRKSAAPAGPGYMAPPLWGPDSYTDGAAMNRLTVAANFTHSNMPNGASYEVPRLSVEDSWDVAAFVASKPRPGMAGLEKDYPDLLQKPVDTPYGPYADGFSPEQHIYGPFGPIRAEVARLKAVKNP